MTSDAPLITAFELRQIARDIADTDTPAWLIGVLNRAARTVDVMGSALHHRGVWSGTECMCDEDPCPGFPDEAVSLPVEEQQ